MRPVTRWVAPAGVLAAIVAGSTLPHALAADGDPSLPPMTAADLLSAVRTSSVHALSGTVKVVADLGLPDVPGRLAGSAGGAFALLSGTNTLRVWDDGADRQRVALVGDLSETDIVHNGSDLWTYDSSRNAVTHRVLPQEHPGSAGREGDSTELAPTAAAQRLLAAIDPTTAVTVEGTSRVAGRSAYDLVLVPRTTDTLIRSVRISVDSATYVPLRAQVFAAGSEAPAWSTAFSAVSFTTPAASIFTFTPPAGAAVTESGSGGSASAKTRSGPVNSGAPVSDPASPSSATRVSSRPQTFGSGWTTVVELPAGSLDAVAAQTAADNSSGRHLARSGNSLGWLLRAATPVPEGRLLTTRVASILVTPDGRIFVGAVPPAAVQAAAAAAPVPAATAPAATPAPDESSAPAATAAPEVAAQ